jgi:3-oxoacyl-[acyl-carrier protein] reductase
MLPRWDRARRRRASLNRVAIDPSNILLTGRVAVVTGGGAGIGRGIAAGMAAFGASVALWERDADTCSATAEAIGRIAGSAGGGALGLVVDVRDSGQVDAALQRTVDELGEVSILVNNAGGVFKSPLLDTTENGWDALYKSNLRHVLLCTQRVTRRLVAAGLPGSVINVTSIEGVRAAPGYAAYAAAKAGVINYTKTAALELAPHHIRVNALAPDLTLTEGLIALSGGSMQDADAPGIPMNRPGHVDEMAGAAVFLASEMSSYITGQTIHVDGGTHAASGWYHHPQTGDYQLGPG